MVNLITSLDTSVYVKVGIGLSFGRLIMMKFPIFLVSLLIVACTPYISNTQSITTDKVLELKDRAYEPQIKTIQLHPLGAPYQPAVIELHAQNLVLTFDDLQTNHENYYVRIEHCTYNWQESLLQDLDYLSEYNEFPITQYEYSVDTHIPYIQYAFAVPRVKLPGNYLIHVYRDSDKEDIILTRRFMVYETMVSFIKEDNLVTSGTVATVNQQLNFTIQYKNLQIQNALTDIHVVIRQNQRWDNLAMDLRPAFIREIEKELEYRFFEDGQMFKGGNEFRFFDIRSLNNPGRNVASVDRMKKPAEVFVMRDKSRGHEAYGQYEDVNGDFFVSNYDAPAVYTNYANINFTLESDPIQGDVYVMGGFTDWNKTEQNKMVYDDAQHAYLSTILLKQGLYDYQYVVSGSSIPTYYFEGSHFQTENWYEVFVYYKPFKPNADLLIGYLRFEKNARRR